MLLGGPVIASKTVDSGQHPWFRNAARKYTPGLLLVSSGNHGGHKLSTSSRLSFRGLGQGRLMSFRLPFR